MQGTVESTGHAHVEGIQMHILEVNWPRFLAEIDRIFLPCISFA